MTECTLNLMVQIKVLAEEGMDLSEAKTAAIEAVQERLGAIHPHNTCGCAEGRKSQPIYLDFQGAKHVE